MRGPLLTHTVREGQRPRPADVLLESSVCLSVLGASLPDPSFPTELCPALGGSPLENQGGDSLRVTGSGRCRVSLQLKSKWDESIFTKGCIQALESWLPRNIYIVAGVFIAISLLQVCSHHPCGFLPACNHTCPLEPDFTRGKTLVAGVARGQG